MSSDGTAAFISYSREDSEFVLRMARDLKAASANVWLDQLDIHPGQRWARALQDAMTNSPRFIVILSPASLSSTNVEDEVAFALEEHKTIIPVLYRDCKVPFQLRPFQYADFRLDYDRGLKILLLTLEVDAPAGTAATVVGPEEVSPKTPSSEGLARAAKQAALEEQKRKAAEQARREEEESLAADKARVKEARLAAERAQAAKKQKQATEQARREQAAEQARLEEKNLAAERVVAQKRRKDAAEQSRRVEEARKAEVQREIDEGLLAAKKAEEEAVNPVRQESEPASGWIADLGINIVVGVVMLAVVVGVILVSNWLDSKTRSVMHSVFRTEPESRPNVSAEKLRETQHPGAGVFSTLAESSPSVALNKGQQMSGDPDREALLGEHRLSLQWISWDKFGKAVVTDNNGHLTLSGEQRIGTEYLTVVGDITDVQPKSFMFHGTIVTKTKAVNNGQPCTRTGDMKFAITGARRYWRLQKMDNPCEAVTDYIDIYLR